MLSGTPTFQIILTANEQRLLAQEIADAAGLTALKLAEVVAQTGVKYLSTFDERAGHPLLSTLWTYSQPVRSSDGTIVAEIYSHAEDVYFYAKDYLGRNMPAHVIKGSDLLAILEAGAKPHEIAPRLFPELVFRATIGHRTSQFLGTKTSSFFGSTVVGVTQGRWQARDLAILDRVQHPGVSGNHFIETTGELLENDLAYAEQFLQGLDEGGEMPSTSVETV